MKTGARKFTGFIISILLYTTVMIVAIYKVTGITLDLSAFAVQASIGYCGICGLFFSSNVMEHFADSKMNISTDKQ